MTSEYSHLPGRVHFNSVQEFWDSELLDGQATYVRQAPFEAKLEKGILDDGKLREFTRDDLERGIKPDILIVLHLVNYDRASNYERKTPPPRRTGLLSAFMDEAEEVATLAGCQITWVEKVFNEFLREKLENRGYQKLPYSDSVNPDYVKFLRHG